ncbi:MAG: ATP-binding protein, partial [Holophaga sp.]
FRAELSQAPVRIWTDALRLRQVLSNLLSNAGKFTENGKIVLRVEASDGEVRFTVQDTGIGMSEEELKRVFLEFVQADTGTTRKYGGTGLGLALVRRLTGLLAGQVEAHSQPGIGTTFLVRLPIAGPVV